MAKRSWLETKSISGDGDQDEHDDERGLLQLERADRLGEMQADAAGADDADDAGRARVRFEDSTGPGSPARERPRAGCRSGCRARGCRRSRRCLRPACGRPPPSPRRTACRTMPMSAVMMASAPANGPSPTTLIQISAHTRISTLRMVSSERRDRKRTTRWAVTLRAASRASGRASTAADSVPRKRDGDGLEQRHAESPRMRPAARIGRQHQADDLDQRADCRRAACRRRSRAGPCRTAAGRRPRRRVSRVSRRWRSKRAKCCGWRSRMATRSTVGRRGHQRLSSPADQAMAHLGGQRVDDRHRDQDQQQDGRDVGIVELADRLDQVLADAAGADEAHDGRFAHVDLEAQQRVAHEIRRDLRQRAVAHGDVPGRAGRRHALDRLHVDVLDDLGEQLAERAQRMDDDGQHAGHRAEPEGDHEHQREDQQRHGAAKLAEAAHGEAQPAARRRHWRRPGRTRPKAPTAPSSVPT